MTRAERENGRVIRCWRQEDSPDFDVEDNQVAIYNALQGTSPTLTDHEIALTVLQLDRVNAVEVLNRFGCGVVLYKNWP